MAFLVCAGCSRHIKGSESACPFCGAAISDARTSGDPSLLSARTRNRLLFGAATAAVAGAVVLNGCSSSSSTDGQTAMPAYGLALDAAYGGPFVEDANDGTQDASDEASDDGGTEAAADANDLDAGDSGG